MLYIVWTILTILIAAFHLVTYFIIVFISPNYRIIDEILKSAPLFDFEISPSCINKTALVLHKWRGRGIDSCGDDWKIIDETDLEIVHGQKICYKSKTYKDLLYNNQIKKNNCDSGYKSCGIIDTLGQILCVNYTEKCPLYDIWISRPNNISVDNYSEKDGIYYNNESYKGNKIIGNLILSDGQPCYYNNEILWRKFQKDEMGNGKLQYEKEILGNNRDDRYEERGNMTNKELYLDNLPNRSKEIIISNVKNETVSLFKRLLKIKILKI